MFTASLYLFDALDELTTEELQLVKGCLKTKDDARLVMELVSSNGIYMPNEDEQGQIRPSFFEFIITYLVSSRGSIKIWRVCQIYGRQDRLDLPNTTCKCFSSSRTLHCIHSNQNKKKITTGFVHIRQRFCTRKCDVTASRTTS